MNKITGILLMAVFSFNHSNAQKAWQATPLHQMAFMENMGQVVDQHGKKNKEVKFIYAEGLFNLQLKQDGFSYELFEITKEPACMSEAGWVPASDDALDKFVNDRSKIRSHRIDVKLVGANRNAMITGISPADFQSNFYTTGTSPNGVTGVSSFEQIRYTDVYPGIDLEFTAPDALQGTCLKYEWIVHPGADASRIKLKYQGASSIVPVDDAGFKIVAGTGTIDESKVIAFTAGTNLPVAARYHFSNNVIGYQIERDRFNTIIIDPNILWASYYGGELSEDINNGELAIDKQKKVILAGSTLSTLYVASSGAYQTTYGGGYHDAFVAKFTAGGQLNWATYYGSANKDEGHAIVTDGDNNIYLAGLTTSKNGISTAGAFQTNLAGYQDAFLVKFNPGGNRIWATYLGGSIQDEILDMDCDKNGNIFFSGYTISPDNIATPGAHQDTMNNPGGNNGDAFLGEFTPNGTLKWCSYFSGPAQDRAHGICVGKNGDLYIEGTCESETQFATAGVFQSTYGGGGTDAFIAKWDTTGNFYWCSYVGGEKEDHGRGVKTDGSGNPYLIGWTASAAGIASPGAFQPQWFEAYENDGDPKYDGFLIKFHPDGSREWGTYYGGGGKDQIFTLAVDNKNDVVYCGGLTASTNNISSAGSYQPDYGGSTDGFFAKFTFGGVRLWGSYFGAADNDELHGMGLDKSGYLYLFLSTSGNSFSVTPDAYQTSNNGANETIVARISPSDYCLDKYEPNNTYDAGAVIKTFDDPNLWGYTAAISTSADADWYKIKLQGPTNLKLVLTDLPADYDLNFYKGNGQLLFSSANAGSADETIIYNGAPNGNYIAQVVHDATQFDPYHCYRILPITSESPWLLKIGDQAGEESGFLQAHVYPNPAAGQIFLKLSSPIITQVDITVYNLLHQPVYSTTQKVSDAIEVLQIPADQLAPGVYLIELVSGNTKTNLKVMVQ